MKKVLVVDDSALMRKLLKEILEGEGGFEVITARNGREAVDMNLQFEPDLITLDINMPEMDGLTALSYIMTQRPVPVLVISSITEKGALATFEALNLGAVDYVTKPGGTISLNIDLIRDEILQKASVALRARIKRPPLKETLRKEREKIIRAVKEEAPSSKQGIVIIGASTGGPRTLEEILTELPADFPYPVIVAQHMPGAFTKSFAERLNLICQLEVKEVDRLMPLNRGEIYIAKGGTDAVVGKRGETLIVQPKPENPSHLWHPSVEVLGRSVLTYYDPKNVIAVMLTGMGYDGADAFAEIKKRGGRTIAESEDSAVVFGMPFELIERKGATVILPAAKIAAQLVLWTKNSCGERNAA